MADPLMPAGEGGGLEPNKVISVEIFGQQLHLKSAADPSYTAQLAEYVDGQIRKVSRQSNDPLKVVLLASMNIANELHEERKKQEEADDMLSRRADSLLQRIERSF